MGRRISELEQHSIEVNSIAEIAAAAAETLEKLASVLQENTVAKAILTSPQKKSRLTAKQIYDARRRADKMIGITGFSASPAFDALLDLHINETASRAVSVSSACIGAACPPTTALRWVHLLEQMGLVCRAPDPLDHRRAFLSLTPEGVAKIENAIAQYAN